MKVKMKDKDVEIEIEAKSDELEPLFDFLYHTISLLLKEIKHDREGTSGVC